MTRRPGQRTTVRVLPRLLAAALVAAACSDSLSPRPEGPTAPPPAQRVPEVLQSAAGDITLDQQNSTLGLAGRRFVKGFNPTNPHNGDAIVVTFFWFGSTNIIDSVTDHLTNTTWTKVGNTYRLVEYVTAGGISMATYVALNVQNIPVADPAQDNVLAIEALLSDSVVDGGLLMSAWTGVAGVDQAVGPHLSGSGAGSSPTMAHPGAMTTVNAGALVYGVTMTNMPVGLGTPTGFRSIDPAGSISDGRLKGDGEYTVPASTGSFDPQWTWYFDQSHAGTWMATGLILNPGSPPPPPPPTPPGNLTVTTSTTGSNLDPDGYTVTVDGTQSQPVGINASVTFSSLPAGTHSVAVGGVASNCTVTTANPQSVSVPSGGTATTTFSVSCGAASVGGIVLDTVNGNLGESGRLLLTRFGPRNPHLGDAIVATFFWRGSTNVITSVTDRLSDGTPVGNNYTPVEYVTAGGISMATYLATNVQNYPEGTFPGGEKLLVVQAQLSDSVADGGLMISAWGGVDGASAQAVGAHQSRSGSGSQPTVAAPGPIAINAGALAYGVTMSGTLVGRDPPSGFANITSMSDGAGLIAEGDYAIPAAAGQADPRWTWNFSPSSPGTWLATVLALNPGTAQALGNLTVSTSTTGSNLDPDGYTVAVDGGPGQAIGINGSLSFTNLAAGSHSVTLSGVAANCTVSGGNSQTVSVPSGGTATAAFTVSCSATTGNLTVTTSTSGSSLDPDGYTVTVDGGSPQVIGINASTSYPGLSASSHTVAISGVAANCTVSGGNSQTVSVPAGGTVTAPFSITCTAVVSASQSTVTAAPTSITAGSGSSTVTVTARDASGNLISGASVSLTATGGTGNTLTPATGTTNASGVFTATFTSTSTGTKTISATAGGVAITQTASVAVTPGPVSASQSTVTAAPTSIAAGSGSSTITVTARDANGNAISGATVVLSATGTGNTLTQPGSTNASGVATGTLSSTVAETKTVSATISGAPINQTATVTVTASTGDLTVTTNTTGQSLDPNGYTVSVDGGAGQAIGINGSATFTGLSAANHTVTLGDVAANCTVNGGNTQTVAVPGGGTATAPFSVACTAVVSASQSTVTAAPTSITAGSGSSTITVTARDASGNTIGGASVSLTATGGTGNTLSPATGTTNGSGVFTATFSSTSTGGKTISATAGGVAITPTASVTVTPGPVSASQSTVTASPTSITAGSGASTITVTARDASGNLISGASVSLTATGGGNTLTQPASTTNGSGVAAGSLSSTVAGSKTVSATISGVLINQTAAVTVTPGPVSASQSSVTASPTSITAGSGTSTITVTARDGNGNAISGATVALSATGTGNTLTQPASTTNGSGIATGTLSSTVAETKTVSATISGVLINQTASVTVTPAIGNLTASTSTTGSSMDPDGYTVTVDGGSPQAIGINASVTYTSLTAGNHTVAISGVATNCTVSGGASRTVSVPSGGTATTTFSVSCVTPNSPPVVNAGPDDTAVTGLLYSFSPSFSDANNDGPWSYRIDWGDGGVSTGTVTSQGSFSVGHTYVIVLPQSFTVRVTVTDSHGASASDTKVVSVLLL